ncbi:hypothetical protein GCM10025876_18730 [Demequina litorisediminis]|uniref:Flagellar secretion chaperone FliS n=1 Tax=Demequina litorisediminis TaxID=1849022 RepID=A0ABQ6IG31_9MICO|nr:hypothetical protein GCM10025876_18730 [Demequina litorisediminis]
MTVYSYDAARNRYLDDAVATAAPATLLLMMYERLVRDLERAEVALGENRRDLAHRELIHAQDIVAELSATLDASVWDGAAQMLDLYGYLARTLVEANVEGDVAKVSACRGIVEPLYDAWRTAAAQVAQAEPARAFGDLGVA